MRLALLLALVAVELLPGRQAVGAEPSRPEQVQSDVSQRVISIQSNFTGIEIVLFGSIDFSRAPSPDEAPYDVIMVIRGPNRPVVVRRKEQIAGLWMNGASQTFPSVPGFYAVLASRPFRAVAPEAVLKKLGIGFSNLDFGKTAGGETADDGFRANLTRLQQEHGLFQESDDAISFLGRSLFRGSVALPVNVPIGRYTTQVFLFRDGKLLSQSQSSLQVEKVGVERVVYMLAFHYPFFYGLLAVLMAVSAGLLAWTVFRRE
ncbi:TIGR02186 family protein [Methyloceanibacter sp.]|uniref:TIGR02186 family protein n=1 Tax=Methyloceanibacter sp. TaxID=1965321 RepID=UPI003D6DA03A